MSDKIIVMSAGRVEQLGAAEDVYNNPASKLVASFLGAADMLEAKVIGKDASNMVLDAPHYGKIPLPLAQVQRMGDAPSGKPGSGQKNCA